jgi:nitroreductase
MADATPTNKPAVEEKPPVRTMRHRVRRRLLRFWKRLDHRLAPWCARSPFRSSLYYGLWSHAMSREHQGVLFARGRYVEEMVDAPKESSSLLRRNTHRLEKGLIMRPRRGVFGLAYVEDTVQCYENALAEPSSDARVEPSELKWTFDVLTEYFGVTEPHPVIDAMRERFKALALPGVANESSESFIPYKRDLHEHPVSYEQLFQLSRKRRSVRWFLSKPVPRELIDQSIALAAQSPSACNRQPFRFLVFDQPKLVREVSSLPGGTAGFNQNFPAIIVVLGRLRNYFHERDRHLIYIDGSLATMSFVLAAETLGLSTCCINWPDYPDREARARTVLKLEPDERPVMFIAVGYPDPEGAVPYSAKKSLRQLRRYNFE